MAEGLNIRNGQISLQDGDRRFRLEITSLTISPGQAVALTGASGSGKTLMLELLGLLRPPGPGTCYQWTSQGERSDLASLWENGPRSGPLAKQRGALFGFVPQTGGLLPFLTVRENIQLPQKLNNTPDDGWITELTTRLGLNDVTNLYPGALSIGQRQRTAIARALSHRPPFIIADEPTAALDPDTADIVLQLLLDASARLGSGVILSSHDVARINRFNIPRLTLISETRGQTITSRLEATPC